MLMIVAHHFVVLSGLDKVGGPMSVNPFSLNSIYLFLFGMWGKTGINCFLMITGYFMCTSKISVRKFLKLYLWILFYRVTLTVIFLIAGRTTLSPRLLLIFLPFTSIRSDNFASAFMAWWLFIPFLNILINNITKKQHLYLIGLLILIFSIYSFVPKVLGIDVNPICWFSTIYVIASYIRKYPETIYKSDSAKAWGWISFGLIALSMISVVTILWLDKSFSLNLPQWVYYYMVSDSQKPLALLVAVATFMWFKNIKIRYSKIINILGGASFGVLLIHSGSRTMMNWLWSDVVDCVGHYALPIMQLVGFSLVVVIAIYVVCATIDYARLKFLEEPFFRWYDKKQGLKMK